MSSENFLGEMEYRLYQSALKDDGDGTFDIKLRFGNSKESPTLHAHSGVLMNESNKFKVILKKSKDRKVIIPLLEDDIEDFKKFLQLAYGFRKLARDDYGLAIPAFKIATKYDAANVMTYLEDYFEEYLTVGWDGTDWKAAGRALVLAKKYDNQPLCEGILKHIKTNPWLHICHCKEAQKCDVCLESMWFNWDEDIFAQVLSAKGMVRGKNETGALALPSDNERDLLVAALNWINHQSKLNPSKQDESTGPSAKSSRVVDNAQAICLLQKIHFRVMGHEHFGHCLHLLHGLLTDVQIAQICLMYFDGSEEKLKEKYGTGKYFVMDTTLRQWVHSTSDLDVSNETDDETDNDTEVVTSENDSASEAESE